MCVTCWGNRSYYHCSNLMRIAQLVPGGSFSSAPPGVRPSGHFFLNLRHFHKYPRLLPCMHGKPPCGNTDETVICTMQVCGNGAAIPLLWLQASLSSK